MILSIILQDMSSSDIIGTIGVAGVLLYLAVVVFLIASMWKVFSKAGQPGWAAIIPIYNAIVFFRVIGRPAWWLLVYIGVTVIYVYGIRMAVTGNSAGGLLSLVGAIALLVLCIIDYHRLSKSFGKGAGFTVGLILLSFIFLPILAFSNARYMGPNGEGGSVNDTDPNLLHS